MTRQQISALYNWLSGLYISPSVEQWHRETRLRTLILAIFFLIFILWAIVPVIGAKNVIAQEGEVKWRWQQGVLGRIGGSHALSMNWHESGSQRSKGNCSNRIKQASQPSQPCSGAAERSRCSMLKTTERRNHFMKQNPPLLVECFLFVIMGTVYIVSEGDCFQMITDIRWVLWSVFTDFSLVLRGQQLPCVQRKGSVKRRHSERVHTQYLVCAFPKQWTSVSLSDVLFFHSFSSLSPHFCDF